MENVNNGFMAVRVPAGDSTIRFDYMTPGLKTGFLITLSGLLLLISYLIIMHQVAKRRSEWRLNPYAHLNRESALSRIAAGDAYAATISRKVRNLSLIHIFHLDDCIAEGIQKPAVVADEHKGLRSSELIG